MSKAFLRRRRPAREAHRVLSRPALIASRRFDRRARQRPARWRCRPQARPGPFAPPGPQRSGELARLEAVLFVARGSLSSRKLAEFAGLADGTQARTLVRRLNELYHQEGSAIRVEEVAGGFHLLTRPCFSPWLRRLHAAQVEVRLSTPALETLSVIAYRQPVLRSELEAIRGVQCGEMLRQLSERNLVRILGRSPELGRPFLYGTTRKFLQVFGLRSLEELPRPATFRPLVAASEPFASTSSEHSIDSQEELEVKIAIFPTAAPEEERQADQVSHVAPEFTGDEPTTQPMADAELEEEEGDLEDDDFEDEEDEDEDEDLEDEDIDDDLEDEDWEEVDDDEDEDWEEDDDWDEDEDEDEDWDDEEE
jgi:segregation and condensation protein B